MDVAAVEPCARWAPLLLFFSVKVVMFREL